MDEIVLKWVTVLSGILTVIVCVSVFFFPDIHERAVLAAEQQNEVGGGNLQRRIRKRWWSSQRI
mgnify:CR=1 FL=1